MHTPKTPLIDLITKCTSLQTFKQIHAQILLTSNTLLKNQNDTVLLTISSHFFSSHVHNNISYPCNFLLHYPSPTLTTTFPYNTLLSGYSNSQNPILTFLSYNRLLNSNFVPDMFTFPPLLKACTRFKGFKEGLQLHCVIIKMGFVNDVYVSNSLVHFYAVVGEIKMGYKVFDKMPVRDVVSWTGLISGFVKSNLFKEAVRLFVKMDVSANIATFVSVVIAIGRLGWERLGTSVHGMVCKRAFGGNVTVCNGLIDMYVKCGCLVQGRKVFDEMSEKDIVSWTSMISGLVQCERPEEALRLFGEMRRLGVECDGVVLTSVVTACASLGALEYGRWIHEYIDRENVKWDVHILTALIGMYAKCGVIDMAFQTFYWMSCKNVRTWNALISGLAMHGHGNEAIRQFEKMIVDGFKPNEVTFLAILTACCHSGMVEEGHRYFNQMTSKEYVISPRLEHYGCMVDLFCKAGHLDEAQELITSMPMQPDVHVWSALLSACKENANFRLSQDVLDRLIELETQDSGVYVLLSNIYAANERWDDVTRVRRLMKDKGIRTVTGSSAVSCR